MKASTFLVITSILLFIFHRCEGHKKLSVRQPLFIQEKVGESVTIWCFFETESPSFTVKWTLCCNQLMSLLEHQSYKNRVTLSSTFQEITIINVTEQDSEKYCCEVLTADGETGVGNGTSLVVAPYMKTEGCYVHTIYIVVQVIRFAVFTIIIILLCVIINKLP